MGKTTAFSLNGPFKDTLQLSGTENVFLYHDGSVSIHMGNRWVVIDPVMLTMIMAFLEQHSTFINLAAESIFNDDDED